MSSANHTFEQGFTAVELLITLIIASVFLFAGYQLFTQVTRDGSSANRDAELSSIAYERMRKAALDASTASPSGCAAASEGVTTTNEAITGIGTVTFKVTIDCPYSTTPGSLTDIFLVKVEASYPDAGTTRKVEHATFTN
jgi:prepilin-type N-terminal cleavage/methylation domain-containing protein